MAQYRWLAWIERLLSIVYWCSHEMLSSVYIARGRLEIYGVIYASTSMFMRCHLQVKWHLWLPRISWVRVSDVGTLSLSQRTTVLLINGNNALLQPVCKQKLNELMQARLNCLSLKKWFLTHHTAREINKENKQIFISYAQNGKCSSFKKWPNVKIKCNRTKWTDQKKHKKTFPLILSRGLMWRC